MATLSETLEAIDVAPDVIGQTIPETLDPVAVMSVGAKKAQVVMSGAVPPHDHRTYTWTAGNCTQIVYRLGGALGATVCTYAATYDVDENIETESWVY